MAVRKSYIVNMHEDGQFDVLEKLEAGMIWSGVANKDAWAADMAERIAQYQTYRAGREVYALQLTPERVAEMRRALTAAIDPPAARGG